MLSMLYIEQQSKRAVRDMREQVQNDTEAEKRGSSRRYISLFKPAVQPKFCAFAMSMFVYRNRIAEQERKSICYRLYKPQKVHLNRVFLLSL